MFETTSEISIKDNKSEIENRNGDAFSLPFIPAKPSSRGDTHLRKELAKKQNLTLPNIKQNQAPSNHQRSTNQDARSIEGQKVEKVQKNTFTLEVEQKLKKVLGGMQVNAEKELVESYDSDDFDFEAQINKNKQIIKQHKIKKQNEVNIVVPSQKQKNSKPPKNQNQKNRNESLYEKRAKQYKDNSMENKYLSKRKQILKDKNQVRDSQKDIKSRNQIPPSSNKQKPVELLKRSKSKAAINNRIMSHKQSQKNIQQINKSVNLFDGIQNFLENPREIKRDSKEQLVGLSLLKAKRDIQDKIRAINQQLGHPQEQHEQVKAQPINSEYGMKQWRRIQFRGKYIQCQDSNFDKELDRISSLQQKNSLSLDHYVEHQKILLQLDLHRKALGSRKQGSSSQ